MLETISLSRHQPHDSTQWSGRVSTQRYKSTSAEASGECGVARLAEAHRRPSASPGRRPLLVR